MSPTLKSLLLRWRGRLVPEAHGLGWMPFYTLGYLVFLFMPLVLSWFGESNGWRQPLLYMLAPTLLSILVFLPLYFAAYRATGVRSLLCTLTIAAIGYALLPYNPFANAYTIYAVGFAAMLGGRLWKRLTLAMAMLGGFLAEVMVLEYPIFIFLITLIVSVAVFFGNHHFVESNRKRAELKLSHDEVRRLAALAERERIGRDLHDLLGHTLSLIAIKSELAGKLIDRDISAAAAQIGEIEAIARKALGEVREAVSGIRASGFSAELATARLSLLSAGVSLDARIPALPQLASEIESALALSLREAVTNIVRHAAADRVEVELQSDPRSLALSISDDGRGCPIKPGNGLTGMRERIEQLGGRLSVDSAPGVGTRLRIWLPITEAASA